MASPLRDGSFDVAEIVLFATPSYSIWLGPPKVALAGVPLRQGQAGCLSGPNERWESACCGSWWSYQQAHPACTGSSHEKDRVAVQLERNHDSQHPLPRAGRALSVISPLVDCLPKTLPVALRISGNTVLNIGCPTLRLREQACSIGRPPQLRVNKKLPWRGAVLVVQFDLPRPQ
jgi:hypothetical protein